MTDRIKITKELLVEVAKFLFTPDDITRERSEYLVRVCDQILEDHEKAEKYNKISQIHKWAAVIDENKQLKEKLEKTQKWLEYSLDGFTYPNEYNNLLKLQKIIEMDFPDTALELAKEKKIE